MKKYLFPCLAVLLLLVSHAAYAGWGDALKQAGSDLADQQAREAGLSYTPSEALAGIREVLSTGTDYGVSSLTSGSGFSADPATSLSLPGALSGLAGSSNLLSAMNDAAKAAVPDTGELFKGAIGDLSASNPTSLLGGSSTAITDYFESASRDTLKPLVRPVVEKCAAAAGVDAYMAPLSAAMQASGTGAGFDANDYLTDKVLDSMYYYVGKKETALRESGGAGASALLQKLL
jgi:hypothetical protein